MADNEEEEEEDDDLLFAKMFDKSSRKNKKSTSKLSHKKQDGNNSKKKRKLNSTSAIIIQTTQSSHKPTAADSAVKGVDASLVIHSVSSSDSDQNDNDNKHLFNPPHNDGDSDASDFGTRLIKAKGKPRSRKSNETKTTTSATANTKSSQQDDGSGDDSDIQIVGDPDEVELTPPPKTHDGDDTGCDYYADFFKNTQLLAKQVELEEEQWNNIWLEDEEEEDVFANLDPELTKLIHNNTSSSLSSSSSSLLLPLKTAVDGGINPSSSSLSLENTDDGTPETFYLECYCESRLGADGRKTAEIPIRKSQTIADIYPQISTHFSISPTTLILSYKQVALLQSSSPYSLFFQSSSSSSSNTNNSSYDVNPKIQVHESMQQYYDYKDKHKALLREQIARAHMERNNIEDDDVDIGDGAVEGDSEDLILIHVQDQSGAIAKLKVKNTTTIAAIIKTYKKLHHDNDEVAMVVKLKLDGEILDPTDTIQDLDIEGGTVFEAHIRRG